MAIEAVREPATRPLNLRDYGVGPNAVVHLLVRLIGGAPPSPAPISDAALSEQLHRCAQLNCWSREEWANYALDYLEPDQPDHEGDAANINIMIGKCKFLNHH